MTYMAINQFALLNVRRLSESLYFNHHTFNKNRRGLSVWNSSFVEGGIKELTDFLNRPVFDVSFDSLIDIKWDHPTAFCFHLPK